MLAKGAGPADLAARQAVVRSIHKQAAQLILQLRLVPSSPLDFDRPASSAAALMTGNCTACEAHQSPPMLKKNEDCGLLWGRDKPALLVNAASTPVAARHGDIRRI